jgi:hypothetical protein
MRRGNLGVRRSGIEPAWVLSTFFGSGFNIASHASTSFRPRIAFPDPSNHVAPFGNV